MQARAQLPFSWTRRGVGSCGMSLRQSPVPPDRLGAPCPSYGRCGASCPSHGQTEGLPVPHKGGLRSFHSHMGGHCAHPCIRTLRNLTGAVLGASRPPVPSGNGALNLRDPPRAEESGHVRREGEGVRLIHGAWCVWSQQSPPPPPAHPGLTGSLSWCRSKGQTQGRGRG